MGYRDLVVVTDLYAQPEGNLFRDRFMSLQQRALIEPRVRVLPKRRTHKIVEYEKHAWKKFDRE